MLNEALLRRCRIGLANKWEVDLLVREYWQILKFVKTMIREFPNGEEIKFENGKMLVVNFFAGIINQHLIGIGDRMWMCWSVMDYSDCQKI